VDEDTHRLTIGTAIRGHALHILNRGLRRQPPGAVGELFVSGIGVASHYINQPGLSATQFVPDPFSGRLGAVMYRTGDLCRQLPNGEVEFVGRTDQQVKVRGHRIELTDIETVLLTHPHVAAAAVVVTKDRTQPARLTAFLVAPALPETAAEGAGAAGLRAWMADRRPDYYTPHRFMALDRMPLTSNGKLDRKALEALALETADAPRTEHAMPVSDAERELASIWADLFGLEQIGTEDNFFELGGDSMVGMRMISALRQRGYKVTAKQIFGLPTIAKLAPALERETGAGARQESFGTFPLMPMAQWLLDQELRRIDHWNQVVTYTAPSDLPPALVRRALGTVLGQHPLLAARFDTEARTVTIREDAAPPAMTRIDFSGLGVDDIEAAGRRVGQGAHRSFDIAGGVLCRAVHLHQPQYGEDAVWLFLHHLVSDIVTLTMLDAQINSAVHALRRGAEPELPERSDTVAHWTLEMVRLADDPAYKAREISYWQVQPRSGPAGPAAGESRYADARHHDSSLDADLVEPLLDTRTHDTLNSEPLDLLLAAFGTAYLETFGGTVFTAALEGHGREAPVEGLDVSSTPGWFTSLQPVAFEAAGGDPVEAVLAAKEARRGAPSGGLGYGLLRYLSADAEARAVMEALPAPRVAFNYSGGRDAAAPRAEAALRLSRADTGALHDPASRRPFALDVNCGVTGGLLWLRLGYDPAVAEERTIARLASRFADCLQEIVDACRSNLTVRYTPHDFAGLDLDQGDLDALIAEIAAD
jgi:non-ribosomal peptide synthase protein (TIGR01720 family)